MKKVLFSFSLIFAFLLQVNLLFSQTQIQKHSILFETAKSNLDQTAKSDLEKLAQSLINYADYSIQIEAHTDDQGDNFYNQKLAEARSLSVKEFLLAQGILIDNVVAKSFGEENPEYDNESEEGRQMNRRVDVLVSSLTLTSFDEIKKDWKQNLEQKYEIEGNVKNQILGEKGTQIWIEEETFVTAEGTIPTGKIEIKLTECYGFGDMLLADLTTTSDGRILETGGMIRIEAYADGEKLEIAENKELLIASPTSSYDDDMKIFYGEGHEDEEEQLDNWALTDSPVARNMNNVLRFAKPPKQPIKSKEISFSPDSTFMPLKPVMPAKKKIRSISYPDTNVVVAKRLFTSKRKVEKERKAKVDKILSRYEKRLKRREYEEKAYLKSLEKFMYDTEKYRIRMAEWEQEIKEKEARFYNSEKYMKTKEMWDEMYKRSLEKYTIAIQKYNEYKSKKLEEYETAFEKTGAAVDAKFMNQYFFRIKQTGWINLDKFSKKKDLELLVFKEDVATQESAVYAIFKNTSSIIRIPRSQRGVLRQQKFPSGEEVIIIGWRVENGQPMLAQTNAKIGSTSIVNLDYKKIRLKDLRVTMEQLN